MQVFDKDVVICSMNRIWIKILGGAAPQCFPEIVKSILLNCHAHTSNYSSDHDAIAQFLKVYFFLALRPARYAAHKMFPQTGAELEETDAGVDAETGSSLTGRPCKNKTQQQGTDLDGRNPIPVKNIRGQEIRELHSDSELVCTNSAAQATCQHY